MSRKQCRWLSGLAVLPLVLLAGCGQKPARPGSYAFAHLEGKLVYDEPFLVVPSRAWQLRREESVWFFGHSASLICHVNETPDEDVVFAFLPRSPEDGSGLDFLWNGRDVSDRVQIEESGEIRVGIPAVWLTPGLHFLGLRQRPSQERSPSHERSRGLSRAARRFDRLGYRFRETPHVLEARHFLSYRYLSSLLMFGVTGSFDLERLGGFVFSGPRTVRVDLGSETGGSFRTRVQNSGAGRAYFRVRWTGAEHEVFLRSHERRQLHLTVPPGTDSLELEVEGDRNGFFLWGAPHFQPERDRTPPPVVLVTLDTTRRDALGAYGAEGGSTPHLDAFASRAAVFENAYTTASWTLPAHASIMTGLYPSRHGAGVAVDHLEIGFDTLAEILRRRGYLTAGFAGGLLSSSHFGVGQGFALYRDVDGFETPADQLTEPALDFLRRIAAAPGTRPPIFLFVNYFDPHFPYRAPPAFRDVAGVPDRRRAMGPDEVWQRVLDGSASAWGRAVDGEAPASPQALGALNAAYRAEVAFLDEQLGRLLAALEEHGLFDDALVIVTSDHGELLGEGGRFSHSGRLDSELVEVPLLVKWPGQKKGRREARLASLVDLFPTILATAGVPLDTTTDGLALRRNGRDPQRGYAMAEEHDRGFHRLPEAMRVARDLFAVLGRTERLVSWDGGRECYRREAERWLPVPCDGSRVFEHGRVLKQELQATAHVPRVDRVGLSRREREHLRALGYLR